MLQILCIQANPSFGLAQGRELYTQVAIRKLKEIHTATHPAKVGNTFFEEIKSEIEGDIADMSPGPEQKKRLAKAVEQIKTEYQK